MKVFIILLAFLIPVPAQPVTLDLPRYLGLWHEIYSIPQSFQRGCLNVTAEYTLKDNQNIRVVNTCRDAFGKIVKAREAEAVVKGIHKAYLKVYFFRPFDLNLFGGDYYVLALDPDYQWALVGTPDHKYGWVLSRSPKLSSQHLTEVLQEVKNQGFDFSKFKNTQTKY